MRLIIANVNECQDAFISAILKEMNTQLTVLPSDDHIHKIKGRKPCEARVLEPLAQRSESHDKSSLFSG